MGSQAIFGHSLIAAASIGGTNQLLVGTTVIAAFFAGMVALFAPCCVSVMLPAYLATGVQRRRGLVAMTFVFAAGVGAVILPIAFGATALSRLISGEHTIVYSVMAVVMLAPYGYEERAGLYQPGVVLDRIDLRSRVQAAAQLGGQLRPSHAARVEAGHRPRRERGTMGR